MKAAAVVLTVTDGQDLGMVYNDEFLTLKKQLRVQEWTEIVECDDSMASSLVECKLTEDENCLYRSIASESASAHDVEWLGLYLSDKHSQLYKKGCQF